MNGARHTTYPAFTTIRHENGVWRLQLAEGLAPWFKRALWSLPFVFFAAFGAGALLVRMHVVRNSYWPGVPIAAGEIACACLLLLCFYALLAALLAPLLKGEVLFDGKTLRFRDRGSAYDIPVDQIRSVRQVSYGTRRTEVDTGGHPSHFLHRGPKTALEIETPGGRLEFFHIWDQMKVAWLAENIRRLVLNQDRADAESALPQRSRDAVISTSVYGKPRRQLVWGLLTGGILLSCVTGWFTYIAWNSRHWPQVQGRVLSSEYREFRKGETSYSAEISYAYAANGREFTNDDIGISRAPSDDDVKAMVISHPRGSTVSVYFDPSKPARSLLMPGLTLFQAFWSFIAALPLLGALPLLLRPTAAAQDALAARYKVEVKNRGDADPSSTLRWHVPDEVWNVAVHSAKWNLLWMCLRINAIAGLSVWLSHHFLAPVIGPEISWRFITLVMLGFPIPMMLLLILDVFQAKWRRPAEYGVNDKGILIPSRDHPIIRWSRIASFTVIPHRDLPEYHTLCLHLKDGNSREISLPTGDLEDAVLRQVSSELPQFPPPQNASPLKAADWIVGLSITAAFTWIVATLFLDHIPARQKSDVVAWVLIGAFIAGPGTWLSLALRNRRAPQQRFMLALAMNMITALGLMLLIPLTYAARGFH